MANRRHRNIQLEHHRRPVADRPLPRQFVPGRGDQRRQIPGIRTVLPQRPPFLSRQKVQQITEICDPSPVVACASAEIAAEVAAGGRFRAENAIQNALAFQAFPLRNCPPVRVLWSEATQGARGVRPSMYYGHACFFCAMRKRNRRDFTATPACYLATFRALPLFEIDWPGLNHS